MAAAASLEGVSMDGRTLVAGSHRTSAAACTSRAPVPSAGGHAIGNECAIVTGIRRPLVLRLAFFLTAGVAALVACSERSGLIVTPDSVCVHFRVIQPDTGERVPARVYLFKGDCEFRFSPVDAMLPLRPDLFYRERTWRQCAESKVLEATAKDRSHCILLNGSASFNLPASSASSAVPAPTALGSVGSPSSRTASRSSRMTVSTCPLLEVLSDHLVGNAGVLHTRIVFARQGPRRVGCVC